jgi:hypothetical protein
MTCDTATVNGSVDGNTLTVLFEGSSCSINVSNGQFTGSCNDGSISCAVNGACAPGSGECGMSGTGGVGDV